MQPIEIFPDREQASAAAAAMLAESLRRRLARDAGAVLVVSGGTTPVACFHCLARAELPWERVSVMLTDERCVPIDHEQSNQRLVETHLLQGRAGAAHLRALEPAQLADTPAPFAAVLLGMGEDGHFASLFSDARELAAGLDPESSLDLLEVRTAASPHVRISMTMARLLRADRLVLLVFGEAKRLRLRDPGGTPVAALLRQQNIPVSILWSP